MSGTSAGLVSVLVCHPLDTIRVRLQTAPKGRFTGISDVVAQTIRHEGPRALYKGIVSPLVAQALMKATMFVSFGRAKRFMMERNQQSGHPTALLPLWQLYLCGSFAGMCNATVANPFELVRNRLQVQYQRSIAASQYKGPIDCARQIVREGGLPRLWLGLGPMMLRDVPGLGAWYGCFEGVRRLLVPAGEDPSQTPKWKILLSGATAGVAFWVFAFPQDTIKNIVQTRGMSMALEKELGAAAKNLESHAPPQPALKPLGFFATGADLVRTEGVGRLWRGFSIAALRGIPGASSTFLTYQLVLNYVNTLEK